MADGLWMRALLRAEQTVREPLIAS